MPKAEERNKPQLLDQVRNVIRLKHYSIRTEECYVGWIVRFIRFHGLRHHGEMGKEEVEAFLTDLAIKGKVAPSTQNQALHAILFLCREVLKIELPWLGDMQKAQWPTRLPVVMTQDEVRRVLSQIDGVPWIMASLLYGAGLRLMESMRLRVKDIDSSRRKITGREGKGEKDGMTMLPERPIVPIQTPIEKVRVIHQRGLQEGFGTVYLPY